MGNSASMPPLFEMNTERGHILVPPYPIFCAHPSHRGPIYSRVAYTRPRRYRGGDIEVVEEEYERAYIEGDDLDDRREGHRRCGHGPPPGLQHPPRPRPRPGPRPGGLEGFDGPGYFDDGGPRPGDFPPGGGTRPGDYPSGGLGPSASHPPSYPLYPPRGDPPSHGIPLSGFSPNGYPRGDRGRGPAFSPDLPPRYTPLERSPICPDPRGSPRGAFPLQAVPSHHAPQNPRAPYPSGFSPKPPSSSSNNDPSAKPYPHPHRNHTRVPMGAYTLPKSFYKPKPPKPKLRFTPSTSDHLNRTQPPPAHLAPSGGEWLPGDRFLDACKCTTTCTCRAGQRVLYRSRDEAHPLSGSESDPAREKGPKYGSGEIRYILKNELGKNCDDHSRCVSRVKGKKKKPRVKECLSDMEESDWTSDSTPLGSVHSHRPRHPARRPRLRQKRKDGKDQEAKDVKKDFQDMKDEILKSFDDKFAELKSVKSRSSKPGSVSSPPQFPAGLNNYPHPYPNFNPNAAGGAAYGPAPGPSGTVPYPNDNPYAQGFPQSQPHAPPQGYSHPTKPFTNPPYPNTTPHTPAQYNINPNSPSRNPFRSRPSWHPHQNTTSTQRANITSPSSSEWVKFPRTEDEDAKLDAFRRKLSTNRRRESNERGNRGSRGRITKVNETSSPPPNKRTSADETGKGKAYNKGNKGPFDETDDF